MSTTKTYKEKLQLLLNTKTQFKNDIINAGGTIDNSTPFSSYPAIYKTLKGGAPDGTAVEVTTEADMDALLVSSNVGKFYKYTGGTTDKYTKDAYYIIQDSDNPIVQECSGGGSVTIEGAGSGVKAVPNNELVEKLIFNLNLTPTEVDNIIANANLDWVQPSVEEPPMYIAFFSIEAEATLMIMNYGILSDEGVTAYMIMAMIPGESEPAIIYVSSILKELFGGLEGWNMTLFEALGSNEFPLNAMGESELEGIPIGLQNEAIKDIINCGADKPYYKELSGVFEPVNLNIQENGYIDLVSEYFDNNQMPIKVNTNIKPALQSKTVDPSTSKNTISCDSDYYGLSKVVVNPVTSAIDANIKPENIAVGKTILGVYGTYKALIDDYVVRLVDIPADNYNNLNKFKSLQFYWPKTIGDRAFYGCSELKSIWFASTPTSIGSEAFATKSVHNGATTSIILDKLDIPNLADWFKMSIAEDMYLCSKTIYVNATEITTLTIPDDVTELQPWVCAGWLTKSINEVYLPSGLTKIGASAFAIVDTIEEQKSVYIDSLEHWMSIYFVNMDSNPVATTRGNLYINNELIPNELVFDESVTAIKQYTFASFNNLTSISGENVTNIGSGAFCNCRYIKSVNFPKVTSIGIEAFAYLGNNQDYGSIKMKFPNLSAISNGAFRGCSNLRVLDIGGSVFSFSSDTFSGCSNLYTLVLRGSSVVNLNGFSATDHFRNTPFEHGSGTLYVPDGLVDSYRTDYDWKELLKNPTSQVKPLSKYVE